tara:strand:- start:1597 stop:1878 length:282 start_codon:yes stop_codon:yes gene_type:complete
MNLMKFPHKAPKGYEYWSDDYSKTIKRIWIRNLGTFTYTQEQPSAVWGFFNRKTGQFISPINWKKPGKVVDINDTSPYTAMPLNLTPLEAAFQ